MFGRTEGSHKGVTDIVALEYDRSPHSYIEEHTAGRQEDAAWLGM